MKSTLRICTTIALLTFTPTVEAQRPGGGGRGGPGGGGGGRQAGPPLGMNQADPDLQNQQFGNRFGNQNAANQNFGNQDVANQNTVNQNMPSIQQLAEMMIANFDADDSGGLEQAELQNGLTALRQMMQNRNGMNPGQAGDAANARNGLGQNAFGQNAFGQNNQAGEGNAGGRGPRGAGAAGGGANNFQAADRGR